jgi:hypothetical protein
MSTTAIRKNGLARILKRSVFVVFVSRERDMATLRRGNACQWTVPSSARPGDCVVIYKPGASKGWGEKKRPPFESFVAAGLVYGAPRRIEKGLFNAPIDEVTLFPNAIPRAVVAESFAEWSWLKSMRGQLGARVPGEIQAEFLSTVDRLAFRKTSPKSI